MLAGEVHLSSVSAVRAGSLCPSGSACIFNGGGGIGGSLQWRYTRGLTLGAGYEGFFLNGNGVYELTVVQILRASLGYRMLRAWRAHPYVGVGLGVSMLGDSFHYSAMGASADLYGGVEFEISHTLAVRLGLGFWFGTNGPFTSNNDGVSRSGTPDIAVASTLQLGLVILEDR